MNEIREKGVEHMKGRPMNGTATVKQSRTVEIYL
jgi:hypothetical protein